LGGREGKRRREFLFYLVRLPVLRHRDFCQIHVAKKATEWRVKDPSKYDWQH